MIFATSRIPTYVGGQKTLYFYNVVCNGNEYSLYDKVRLVLRGNEHLCGEITSIQEDSLDISPILGPDETIWFGEIVNIRRL